MTRRTPGPPKSGLWAYAYDITLPESEDRIRRLQELLEREHSEARAGARTWAAQVVLEPQVTRILVVSDSPRTGSGDQPQSRSGADGFERKVRRHRADGSLQR
jgi:hypothetical protein